MQMNIKFPLWCHSMLCAPMSWGAISLDSSLHSDLSKSEWAQIANSPKFLPTNPLLVLCLHYPQYVLKTLLNVFKIHKDKDLQNGARMNMNTKYSIKREKDKSISLKLKISKHILHNAIMKNTESIYWLFSLLLFKNDLLIRTTCKKNLLFRSPFISLQQFLDIME